MLFKITSLNYIFYYNCLHQNEFQVEKSVVNENNSSEKKHAGTPEDPFTTNIKQKQVIESVSINIFIVKN